MTIQKKYDKGGQHQMNDRKFELNPYFKKRDLSEKKIAFNQLSQVNYGHQVIVEELGNIMLN